MEIKAGAHHAQSGIRFRWRRCSRRHRRPRRRRCGWPSSCPPTCRCRCTTSRRTPRTRSRPASSTRSLRTRTPESMDQPKPTQRHRSSSDKNLHQVVDEEGILVLVPGGVAQQRLRSSTCSTSSPRSHAPSDTSSFANRCRIGLRVVFAVQSQRKHARQRNDAMPIADADI